MYALAIASLIFLGDSKILHNDRAYTATLSERDCGAMSSFTM